MSKKLSTSSLLAVLLSFCLYGCIRYTPPLSEINARDSKKVNPNDKALAEQVGGPEQFKAYEDALAARLQTLVQSRQAFLSNTSDEYKIGPGDLLDFSVFGFSELSQSEISVSNEGTLTLPLLNEPVAVAGLSIGQVRDTLSEKYRRFIRQPNIIITMKGFQSNSVAVTGAVAKPGLYPLRKQGILVSEILGLAGGRTDKAGNRILVVPAVKRAGNSAALENPSAAVAQAGAAVEVAYEDLLGTINSAPILLPLVAGDTIIVPEAGTFEVDGEVKTPGSYTIAGRTTATSAIAAAGGLSYAAKVDEIEVIRDLGSGKKAVMTLNLENVALKGQQDVRLRDGDLIRVPTASGRHTQRQIVEGINSLFRGVGVSR